MNGKTNLGSTPVSKLLLKMAPPVMAALLIQSIYNIVDSYFIAKYSQAGLTALSIIFPLQLLMIAVATGTGTGINILVSRFDGQKNSDGGKNTVCTGLLLGLINYAAFFALMVVLLKPFFVISTDSAEVVKMGVEYGKIVFYFSFGIFIESNCTKIMQAKGRMVIPMTAQVLGAVVNIILDPILIFGNGFVPELGIRGAAIATVIGQASAMCIVLLAVLLKDVRGGKIKKRLISAIYKEGFPSIVMQSLYTLYIIGLNLILKSFTEDAVTVLGIYYKLQTFFFIPLFGLEYIVLPIVSYNYGARQFDRISQAVKYSVIFGSVLLGVGTFVFVAFPERLLMIFFGFRKCYGNRCSCVENNRLQLCSRRLQFNLFGKLSRRGKGKGKPDSDAFASGCFACSACMDFSLLRLDRRLVHFSRHGTAHRFMCV